MYITSNNVSSKIWPSQLWAQFMQLRRESWKIQDFNGIWTRDLVTSVRCSNQLSHETTDAGLTTYPRTKVFSTKKKPSSSSSANMRQQESLHKIATKNQRAAIVPWWYDSDTSLLVLIVLCCSLLVKAFPFTSFPENDWKLLFGEQQMGLSALTGHVWKLKVSFNSHVQINRINIDGDRNG